MWDEDADVLLDGYPDFGSPSNTLVDRLMTVSSDHRIFRAYGGLKCDCGREYREHPLSDEELDWMGRPYLHALCDGRLAKL